MSLPPADLLRSAVAALPVEIQDAVGGALAHEARLDPATVLRLRELGDGSFEDVMVALLPVAAAWAVVPVSGYRVGAVARVEGPDGSTSLVLGGNLEATGLPLSHTIHAEQAVAARAFHTGATRLVSLTVSAAPCGHCRQFLHELSTDRVAEVLIPTPGGVRRAPLTELLPAPFGPSDLGVARGMLDPRPETELAVPAGAAGDPLVAEAWKAARRSHAPYTGNAAGVALKVGDMIVPGSYLENAAFNPSLPPLHAARINLCLGRPLGEPSVIERAVLVEAIAPCSQSASARALLGALAPGVDLEVIRVARA